MTTQFLSTTDFVGTKKAELFEKRTVAELSADEMMQIDGGTTPVCAAAIASSSWCIGGALFIGGAIVGYIAAANGK